MFSAILFFLFPPCVSATLENVVRSVESIIEASTRAKFGFCSLLAHVALNYSLMLMCKKLFQEGSEEHPELIESAKTVKSWHAFLISLNSRFLSYSFFS